ncbi:SUKH-4 family immunity protein [Priestia flexa]|uniref:SUKH-4 family immunity protein n=1 Tax=Priestia flexa TaxID=86664 RepID=UPI002E1BB494|nr:SUKH-4 family immunity protein [Priestia flexa]
MKKVKQRKEKRILFDKSQLAPLKVDLETKKLLAEVGLPRDVAPLFEFMSSKNQLCTLCETLHLSARYQLYWFLGMTKLGDPICLHGDNGNIVLLDVSNDDCERLINSSLVQFLQFVELFYEYIQPFVLRDERPEVDGHVPNILIREMRERFEEIDKEAMKHHSFWKLELDSLSK